MAKSFIGVRHAACAALLVTIGCGGDGDGTEPDKDAATGEDASTPDTGLPADSGAPDSGSNGGDAGASDSGQADSGQTDAGNDDLARALDTTGERVDMQRVDLVLPAFCRNAKVCNPAGPSEADCLTMSRANWADPEIFNDVENRPCLDATLDVASCAAKTPCEQLDSCDAFQQAEETLCADQGA